MKKIFTIIQALFPELILWTNYPAFLSWIAVSVGIWVAFALKLSSFLPAGSYELFHTILIILAVISLFCGIFFRKKSIRLLSFFFLAIMVCVIKDHESINLETFINQLNKSKIDYMITAECVSVPQKKNGYYTFLLKNLHTPSDKHNVLKSKTFLCKSKTAPIPNHVLSIVGKIQLPQKGTNPFAFDEAAYLISNNIDAIVKAKSLSSDKNIGNSFFSVALVFRKNVITFLERFTNPDHQAILRSAFLGEKDSLTPEIKESFRKCGIYHLLAISGLHAGMFTGAAYVLLSIFALNRKYKFLLSLLFLWLYLLFIGFIPSLFRATIMTSLIIFSFLFQKRNYPLQSLGLAGTLWLLFSPQSLFQPGYQLSFCATFAIITFPPVLNRFYPQFSSPTLTYFSKKILTPLFISICGFLGTAPSLLYHFGTLSVFGLIANIAAVSAMTFGMWFFFVALILHFLFSSLPVISSLPLWCCAQSLNVLIGLADFSMRIKWSEISFSAPYPELIVLYTAFLCLLVTAKKEYFVKVLKWSSPVFLSLCAIVLLIRNHDSNIKLVRFSSKNSSISAIRWPHNGVWLTYQGKPENLDNVNKYIVTPWIHHNPGTFVEKIFFVTQKQNDHGTAYSGISCTIPFVQHDTLSYKYRINSDKKSYFIDIYPGTEGCIFQIKGQNTRAGFNTSDSLISLENFSGSSTIQAPAQVNIGSKKVYSQLFQ
ncbi:MAG: ComEC/Rec2 family competence protein [Fibrobacter sp.]|nr:ComEC/Rec2 family competence protein [Fibrobacter sp.]